MLGNGLSLGNLIRARNVRHYMADGKSWVEYKATSKDEVLLFLFIGLEPKKMDGEGKGPNQILNELGWYRADPCEDCTGKRCKKCKGKGLVLV